MLPFFLVMSKQKGKKKVTLFPTPGDAERSNSTAPSSSSSSGGAERSSSEKARDKVLEHLRKTGGPAVMEEDKTAAERLRRAANIADDERTDLSGRFQEAARDMGMASDTSSDSDVEQEFELRRGRGSRKTDGRLAGHILGNLRRNHASAVQYVRSLEFNNTRNYYESKRWARLIDQLLKQGEAPTTDAMEMAVRNLAGLVKADEYGDLAILEQLEFAPSEEILSRDVFREVLTDARRNAKYKPKKKAGQSSGAGAAKKPGAGRQ